MVAPTPFVVSFLVFALLFAPGVRLLLLARRTGEIPERFGGLYFLGASLGISLRIFGISVAETQPETAVLANAIGHLTLAGGTIAIGFFTARVFHAGSVRAERIAIALALTIATTTAHALFVGADAIENSLSLIVTNGVRVLPTGWACFESFRYWRAMRKREALGLAEPVITNRFGLWTLWTAGMTLLPLIALLLRSYAAVSLALGFVTVAEVEAFRPTLLAQVRLVFLVIVPITVGALMLAFFPPRAYVARLRAGVENAPST